MKCIVQVDFMMDGPFGEEMSREFTDLAKSINEEPGFIWKVWTENAETKEVGGIYLFETKEDADNYLKMHSERLANFGITNIRWKVFEVNEPLSLLNHGPIK